MLAIAGVPLFALTGSACASGAVDLTSRPTDGQVRVDGSREEWGDALSFIEKDDLWLGVTHDAQYLYVALVTRDLPTVGQIVTRGLTVWFDPEGGKDKVLGIGFPLGSAWAGPGGRFEGGPGGGSGGGPSGVGALQDPELIGRLLEASTRQMHIVRTDGDTARVSPGLVPGIEARATWTDLTFAYELKVPLRPGEDWSYGIGVADGGTIGIGLVTPSFDRDAMRGQMGPGGGIGATGGRGGIGGGRGGGLGGGRGGGGRGGGRPSLPEPLDVWARVILSSDRAVASSP